MNVLLFPSRAKRLKQALHSPAIGGHDGVEQGESRLRVLFTLFTVLLGPVCLLLLYDRLMFPGLTNADALDFAQLGRNLSAGRGFVTFVLRPLALTHGPDALHQPELTHGPLYPFLLALAFGVCGVRDAVVAGMSGLFYLLTIPVLYALGSRLASPGIGRIVALLFTINTLNLQYASSGLHLTLVTFLLTSLFLALLHTVPSTTLENGESGTGSASYGRAPLLLAGALAAGLYLTEPLYFWAMPVTLGACLCLPHPRRLTMTCWCLVPMLLLAGPWMLRNMLVSGDPLFDLRAAEIWMNTAQYPGYNAYRMLPDNFIPGIGLFLAVVRKIFVSANQIIVTFPQISAIWILAFFLPSLLFRVQGAQARLVRRVVLSSLLALFLTMLLFSVQMPLFTCLTPVMLIFAVTFLQGLLKQAQMPTVGRVATGALISATMLYPLYSELALSERPLPNRAAIAAKTLSQRMHSEEVCLSDVPWNVAWYGNRPAVWLPQEDTDVSGIRTRVAHVNWLFLTDQTRNTSPAWQYVYEVLLRWNLATQQAQAGNRPLPGRITITDDTRPLMKALQGFTSAPPSQDVSPEIVLANISEGGR